MLRRQIAWRVQGERLLRAHHDRVDEAAQQHHEPEQHVHDADALMIDAGDPLAPKVRQMPLDDDPDENSEHARPTTAPAMSGIG